MAATGKPRAAPRKTAEPQEPDPAVNSNGSAPLTGHVVSPLIPVLHIAADQQPEEEERALLFVLDDEEYTMWLNPPSSVMLEYLDIARNEGPNVAFSWGMETMLGEDAYQVLLNEPRVSKEQFQSLGEIVIGQLMGVDRSQQANGSGPNRRPGGRYARRR